MSRLDKWVLSSGCLKIEARIFLINCMNCLILLVRHHPWRRGPMINHSNCFWKRAKTLACFSILVSSLTSIVELKAYSTLTPKL